MHSCCAMVVVLYFGVRAGAVWDCVVFWCAGWSGVGLCGGRFAQYVEKGVLVIVVSFGVSCVCVCCVRVDL